jgi:hypothetical protein
MSTIKIQVIPAKYRTEVLVDNKFAYQTGIHPDIEMVNLKRLIELLGLSDTVEITDKERV